MGEVRLLLAVFAVVMLLKDDDELHAGIGIGVFDGDDNTDGTCDSV